ncbi:hypothetical protein [Citricoccus muralis]|uniref:Membrane protein DUF2157 n=1 Tax=Citricoccus muralis TaxID=169134 RepID=A0ABY8H937_9MICC|nr:hypothetical protein [Citricoccus muralis]WFP17148.1 hypothetical protein P8192_03205 [Citricoccus muralis]
MTDPTSSDSSDALARLKAQTEKPAAPEKPAESAEKSAPAEKPAEKPAAPEKSARVTMADRLNGWLDSLGSPDAEQIEKRIADTPGRMRRHQLRRRAEKQLRDRREQERQAEEQAKAKRRAELAAAIEETNRLLAERRAVEEAERAETERRAAAERAEAQRLAEAERRAAQEERETEALHIAARELDGTDHVPAPDRRPPLQQPGEELSDAQLLDRARALLPEWRRRDRIVEKARAIETAASAAAEGDGSDVDDRHDHDYLHDAPYVPPYVLPSRQRDPEPELSDTFRQVTVTITWVLAVAAGLVSTGWLGDATSLREIHDGAYRGGSSLLSMAGWWMAILPVLWGLLGAYVLYQWAPSQRSAVRQRAVGWYVANAMITWAAWFLLVHAQPWGLEILAAGATTVLSVRAIQVLNLHTARHRTERTFTDVVIGVFTGWSIVFCLFSVSVVLTRWGANLLWIPGEIWAVLGLLLTTWATSLLTMTERGRMAIALGYSWGLVAIMGARLFGQLFSTWVIIVAGICAFVVILTTENRRYRIARAERHQVPFDHDVDDETDDDANDGFGTDELNLTR